MLFTGESIKVRTAMMRPLYPIIIRLWGLNGVKSVYTSMTMLPHALSIFRAGGTSNRCKTIYKKKKEQKIMRKNNVVNSTLPLITRMSDKKGNINLSIIWSAGC